MNDATVPVRAVSSDDCSASERDNCSFKLGSKLCLTVVVLGASGDLARKKTYPALFALFSRQFLPKDTQIIGYARSQFSLEEFQAKIKAGLKGDDKQTDAFLQLCSYVPGQYDGDEGFTELQRVLTKREQQADCASCGRLYYLALPPSVYPQVCTGLKRNCTDMQGDSNSWLRLIIEKPFGRDLQSSEELADKLGALFPEEQLYRIDHYLGKEIAQNMLVMRTENVFLAPTWNRHYVSNVQITFKEPFGTEGRGGYFDDFGIIRDVMQNHLMQLLALCAMEKPVSMHPDDIRDEKTKVLRCIQPVRPEDCVLGQYTAGHGEPGYLDDPTVPKGSKTPTYATCITYIRNERWDGVPFILKAGKALNERKSEVRVQLKPTVGVADRGGANREAMRNEFVMRVQPDEAIYLKMVVKKPGLEMEAEMSELDLSYKERYSSVHIPEAYERLILDAMRGDQQHFVRRDELRAAWAVFTPLLHMIDEGKIEPIPYEAGTRGPIEGDALVARAGFVRTQEDKYSWKPKVMVK